MANLMLIQSNQSRGRRAARQLFFEENFCIVHAGGRGCGIKAVSTSRFDQLIVVLHLAEAGTDNKLI